MQQHGFVQVPCVKCGTIVWIAQATGSGYCPSCHTPNTLQAGAAPQQMGGAPGGQPQYGMPQQQYAAPMAMPSSGFPIGKLIGGVFGALVIGALSIGGWWAKTYFFGGGGKGKVGWGQLKMDSSKPDGDLMMTSISGAATKWKKDAIWWSTNYQAVRADGTVDVTKGAQVEYISPSKVSSASKKVREDSIKKFVFSKTGVDFSKKWNATNQWKNVTPPAQPTCTIKQLAQKLAAEKGLTGEKTVRISYDPQFQRGTQAWRVIGKDPAIDAEFSMTDCAEVGK